jgi:KaiC/GvpD/RAD55 family RecA-like ATPase
MLNNLLIMLSNEPDSSRRLVLMDDWLVDNPDIMSKEELEDQFYQYLEDITRERLLLIRDAPNPFKSASLKNDLVNWLKLFVSDKQDLQRLIETYSSEAKEAETYTLAQLRELAKDHKDFYLVQGLIRKNILLLIVGAPKTGKSLFATNLAVRVIQGEPFLNRNTYKSRVLFLQNEENVINTYKRIYNNGLQLLEAQEPELFNELLDSENLLIAKHLDLVVDKKTIIKTLEESEADVLIIDSLAASIRKSGLTEYSPELAGVLYDYQEIAHTRNVTILVLHHSTKMDSTESKTSMIRGVGGSNALVRANDGLFKLHPRKDGDVDLFTIPRDGNPEELVIRYVEEEASFWSFEVKAEKTLSPENIALQNSILRLLLESYLLWKESVTEDDTEVGGLNLTELVDILAVPRMDIIKRLNHMYDTEGISRRISQRKYVYHIPASGESWLLAYLEVEEAEKRRQQEQQEIDARMATAVRNTKTREEFLALIQNWTDEEKKRVFNLIDPAIRLEKMLLVNPPKYPVGTALTVEGIEVFVAEVKIKEGKHLYNIRDAAGNVLTEYLEEQLNT